MMCHTPSGYIIFSLKKVKFYGDWGSGIGFECRGPDNPKNLCQTNIPDFYRCEMTSNSLAIKYCA